MAVEFIVNRVKAFLLFILGILRRAMCCLRRRRRSSCDSIPLSTIGVVSNTNNKAELNQWDQWEESPVVVIPDKPVNPIQQKIDQYRQQIVKPPELEEEEPQNYFEDMTPRITKQMKLLIRNEQRDNANRNPSTKFAVATDHIPSTELEEWDENAASWEQEAVEEFGDPTQVLREEKRREREQRVYEQQQKRLERYYRAQMHGTARISS